MKGNPIIFFQNCTGRKTSKMGYEARVFSREVLRMRLASVVFLIKIIILGSDGATLVGEEKMKFLEPLYFLFPDHVFPPLTQTGRRN